MSSDLILATTVSTPIGPLSLLGRGDALVGGGFTADPGWLHARLRPALRALPLAPGELPWAVKPVRDYFDGDLSALDLVPVDQRSGPARERLWAELRRIRPGSPVTYTELARRAGSPLAIRAAGGACASNLVAPVVPCHRVVRTDGSLGGYLYGLDKKRWLLSHESAAS
ncbi:MAG: methylated-DNA--[protein]-cysteine S-methyltransferase [Actinobacteria bacterium]|nr:methylated-DNA--[protein]-cysteine S-methyltransferase [Actinomycetota bacterium]